MQDTKYDQPRNHPVQTAEQLNKNRKHDSAKRHFGTGGELHPPARPVPIEVSSDQPEVRGNAKF